MNKMLFGKKKPRRDRELQTYFTHIALALVMILAQNIETRLVFHYAGKISEASHQTRLFFSGRHDHLIIQESLPFSFKVILLKFTFPSSLNTTQKKFNPCNNCLLGGVMKVMYHFSE